MTQLGHADEFRDLVVYQKAMQAAMRVFEIAKSFPREEAYSLTSQIRRASRSVGAQIAEAWGKRRYEKHFISKLTDADAERRETQHWVDTARACGYLAPQEASRLDGDLAEIGRMLRGMVQKADSFCGADSSTARECAGEYFASPPPTSE